MILILSLTSITGLADVSRVRNYKYKRLDAPVPFGVYECGTGCLCNKHCPTRVVQNGIQVQLQIFKTKEKGWGVRTLHDIPRGAFITVYSAQILSEESADISGHTAGDNYFANLDFIDCAEATKEAYESDCQLPLEFSDDSDELSDANDGDDSPENNDGSASQISEDDEHIVPAMPVAPSRPQRNRTDVTIPQNNDLSVPNPSPRPQVAVKSVRGDLLKPRPQPQVTDSNDVSLTNGSAESPKKKSFRSFFEGSKTYILDAFYKGNVGRFFNHSCSPNSFAQNIFYESHDLRFPTVAFFASRNIFALEEITWDYQYEINSIPGRVMKCHCHSTNCKGRLI